MEFLPIMAYVGSAIGKPLLPQAVDVYWDLLGDLPVEVLQLAAQRVVLQHVWATFPTVAELRQAAVETMQGETAELSGGEAWALAWKAIARIDPEVDGDVHRGCKGLPARVVEAMRAFGINAMCYGKEPVGVIRGQFIKIYEGLLARDKRTALLPAALREAIAAQPAKQLEQQRAMKQVARIGMIPDEEKGADCRP